VTHIARRPFGADTSRGTQASSPVLVWNSFDPICIRLGDSTRALRARCSRADTVRVSIHCAGQSCLQVVLGSSRRRVTNGKMRAFSSTKRALPAPAHAPARSRAPQQRDVKACSSLARRDALLAACVSSLATALPVQADTELSTYYGQATPPTSYGGFGGNSKDPPRYKFDYPASWKVKAVNKVQKV
jgi:hypothetical protein